MLRAPGPNPRVGRLTPTVTSGLDGWSPSRSSSRYKTRPTGLLGHLLQMAPRSRRPVLKWGDLMALTTTGALIVADGPLSFPLTMFSLSKQPVLGCVEVHHHQYLNHPDHLAVLYRLESGSRSSVLQFGERMASHYSWYVRLGLQDLYPLSKLDDNLHYGLGTEIGWVWLSR